MKVNLHRHYIAFVKIFFIIIPRFNLNKIIIHQIFIFYFSIISYNNQVNIFFCILLTYLVVNKICCDLNYSDTVWLYLMIAV